MSGLEAVRKETEEFLLLENDIFIFRHQILQLHRFYFRVKKSVLASQTAIFICRLIRVEEQEEAAATVAECEKILKAAEALHATIATQLAEQNEYFGTLRKYV